MSNLLDIRELRQLVERGNLLWQKHCLERMQEREISTADVMNALATGEVIEEYPTDYPHPSCLIMGAALDELPLHVVAGTDGAKVYLITVYVPNTVVFEEDLKTRRGE